MATAAVSKKYTPEDLLRIPEEGRFELIHGELVERNMGARSSLAAGNITFLVKAFARPRSLGHVFPPDCGYQIFSDSDRVRYADGSFVPRGRLPNDKPPAGHCRVAPELVIEAVSPNDTAPDVEAKVEEWLSASVRLVWVIYPDARRIQVHRADGSVAKLCPTDELDGEDVLPGFKCRAAEVFEGL